MGLGRRVGDQCLHAAEALRKFDHSDTLKDLQRMGLCVHIKGQHRAESSCLLLHDLITRVFRKSRVIDMFHHWLFLQPVCDLDGIFLGPLHADSESLDAS